jgi:transposase-like protein
MRKISYKGYRFPAEIIQRAIWLYLRFTLVTWEMPVVLKVSPRWRMRDRVTLGQKSP